MGFKSLPSTRQKRAETWVKKSHSLGSWSYPPSISKAGIQQCTDPMVLLQVQTELFWELPVTRLFTEMPYFAVVCCCFNLRFIILQLLEMSTPSGSCAQSQRSS